MNARILLTAGLLLAAAVAIPALAQEGDDSFRAKALALNDVTGDEAISGKIRELRKDKPALRKLLAEAAVVAKEKPKELPFTYNAALILARCAHLSKDYEAGELFYRACIEQAMKLDSQQKLAVVFTSLIDLFESSKQYDNALLTCQKFLELANKDDAEENLKGVAPLVEERVIEIFCRQKKFKKAMEVTDKMIAEYGDGWYMLRRKAEVLRESGKPAEAVAMYKKVISALEAGKMEDDEKQRYIEICKYVLTGVYVDNKQVDKSVELLEELVKAKPESSTYANDLGYILADNDLRLEEAEKLVRKALELDRVERKKEAAEDEGSADENKENPAYLDSLAWVYFKQKKYAEARDIMLEVIKAEESQHVEIYDHLAEIYAAMGDKDQAVKTWTKALALDNATNRDDARKEIVKKKLEANK